VDSVPDPLLIRKSGSARNRTQDLWIRKQELWPLDHRAGHFNENNDSESVCFLPQAKGLEAPTLLGPPDRTNLDHCPGMEW
jgi:hypothetical protein